MPKNRQYYRKTKYPDKVTKQNALYLSGYFYFALREVKLLISRQSLFASKKLPHFRATALKLYIQFYKCNTLSAIS